VQRAHRYLPRRSLPSAPPTSPTLRSQSELSSLRFLFRKRDPFLYCQNLVFFWLEFSDFSKSRKRDTRELSNPCIYARTNWRLMPSPKACRPRLSSDTARLAPGFFRRPPTTLRRWLLYTSTAFFILCGIIDFCFNFFCSYVWTLAIFFCRFAQYLSESPEDPTIYMGESDEAPTNKICHR